MAGTEELRTEADFSVICSFFNKFGSFLGLKPQPFPRLEAMLAFDDSGQVDKGLVDLHVQLLRRAGQKSASHKRWEACLLKYLEWDPVVLEERRTVERFGYAHAPLSTKLTILKTLCERQFDWNPKFKEQVAGCPSRELRLLPVGRDEEGKAYFYQLDAAANLRVYSEEPDDDAGRTWTLRANSRHCLQHLIDQLETGGKPLPSTSQDSHSAHSTDSAKDAPITPGSSFTFSSQLPALHSSPASRREDGRDKRGRAEERAGF